MIYMDNAATSIYKPSEVTEAVINAMKTLGNAGRGVNEASLCAAGEIFNVRSLLAELFNAEDPSRIAFTSNATEALNTAIKGIFEPGDHVITTVLEHNSVLRPLYEMEEKGVELSFISCDETGMINPADFEKEIRDNTKAIVCTHGSNVTGNLVDVAAVGKISKAHNLLFIVDASQTAGVMDIDVQEMNIDVLCFTGHKGLLGPQGTGGIYVREGIEIRPLKSGGSGVQTYLKKHPPQMPTVLEAGTLNSHGIAGLGAAVTYLKSTGLSEIRKREQLLIRKLYEGIKDLPGVHIYGDWNQEVRCPILSLNIEGLDSAVVGDELFNTYGISVRSGAHCAPLMHKALGTESLGAVRFSLSHYNTEEEIDAAIAAIAEIVK